MIPRGQKRDSAQKGHRLDRHLPGQRRSEERTRLGRKRLLTRLQEGKKSRTFVNRKKKGRPGKKESHDGPSQRGRGGRIPTSTTAEKKRKKKKEALDRLKKA